MRKFVKIELGSRGGVENVELVESSYELIEKEFSEKLESLKEDEDEDELEYLEEFGRCSINLDKGEVEYGFSEEDCTFYVEVEKNKVGCEILLTEWLKVGCEDRGLSMEFDEVLGGLGC